MKKGKKGITRIEFVANQCSAFDKTIFEIMGDTCPYHYISGDIVGECQYESPSDMLCLECWTKPMKKEEEEENE